MAGRDMDTFLERLAHGAEPLSELIGKPRRRCSLCWKYNILTCRFEHDSRCMACEGDGYIVDRERERDQEEPAL